MLRPRAADASSDAGLLRRTAVRLGAQVAVTVGVIVLALSGVAVLVVVDCQYFNADTLLHTAISREIDVVDPPAGVWLIVRTSTGTSITPDLPPGLPDNPALDSVTTSGEAESAEVDVNGRAYRVLTERRGAATVQAVLDLTSDRIQRDLLLKALLITGGAGLVVAALTGALLGRRAVRPLSAALALQRRFISDASHELRTPLTLLSTRAQLLRRQLHQPIDPTVLKSDVDGLVADAHNLSAVLEDLLLAADPRAEAPTEQIDLVALAEEVTASSTPAAARHSVTLRCTNEIPELAVLGSAAGLRRALNALVDNAIRHAAREVSIAVSRQGNKAVLDVHDDGEGIDPQMLPRLFERFASSAEPTGQRRRYGLGLALVSEIANRHGGTVSAHNVAGRGGATLRLTLPAVTPVTGTS
ncbi:MAG TPA: HAMP domain-containing sensor histidine kinase [Pseudonocardiaceae bacterium]|jgi:signal transduction histidine kinase|nr:HAMP domain-containing sensor histidine kinase [Pseudonocardiaceae bacterium]